jgi:polyphosphate kinase
MIPRYTNRELSILDFQHRVLALAEDPSLPILERVRFLSIVASNLDEFFQVRVAGLREQVATGSVTPTPDGMTPENQLESIRPRVIALDQRMQRLLDAEIRPGLEAHGVAIADWDSLTEEQRKALASRFESVIYPMLTPLAVDPSHPFPYVSNLSLNLAVVVDGPDAAAARFARVKVPPLLPRYLLLEGQATFVPTEQVIAARIGDLFPGRVVRATHAFRVTRSAEQALEDEADDLLAAMEELLETRHRFSSVVRLEVGESMPDDITRLLVAGMGIEDRDVYVESGQLALGGLAEVASLHRPELRYEPAVAATQPILVPREPTETLLDRLADRDVLVHLPYESFATSVGAFIAAAARDPAVVAIKQTLYRTSDPDDPALGGEQSIVHSLIAAARAGKQVVVVVELKARFDEEANIAWARILEEAGVQVVYGIAGLKTHAKLALVVRREGDGLARYSHVGTGNYNPKTARMYEDLGLLTADPDIGSDLTELFNVLTGLGRQQRFRRLLVAPVTLREEITARIRRQAAAGPNGSITMKINHLADQAIIDELYAASATGTPIDLIVRGTCCLRPAVRGLSETITVRSLVGRHLEHSRMLRFGSGDDAEYLIGSADMMPRNLDGRVEALVPIHHPSLRRRIDEMLRVYLADDRLSWQLVDDRWTKNPTTVGVDAQERFQSLAQARAQGAYPDPDRAGSMPNVIVAAGGIVSRTSPDGEPEVLLVHRARYDDWSFPKGKTDPGETDAQAALREVREETGLVCTLGPRVGAVEYPGPEGTPKVVTYWQMSPEGGDFEPNEEVDRVEWLPLTAALDRLTYERDRALLRSLE